MSSRRVHHAFAVLAGFCAALNLHAYVLRTDASNVYVMKWYASPVTMQVKLSAVASLSDGTSPQSTVAAAMQAWNAQLATVQLAPVFSSPGTYANGNQVNEIVVDATIDGDAFPSGALAVTMSFARGNDIPEADIVFNSAYNWDSYRGTLRSAEDLRRVAIHELGHVLGLDHPDQAGQYVDAVMNSRVSNVDSLRADDIAGGRVLYGAAGASAPGNDRFATPVDFSLADGVLKQTGSNVMATREPGESDHAESASVHSLWWRWVAPSNGTMTLDTRGSNFDTVLAVYTGSDVSALTLVASNDDEESSEQNSTPSRKRTSVVTFTVVPGTTYSIVVDGWGSAQTLATGYTGSVSLNANFAPLIAPVITTQPANVVADYGANATFRVVDTGRPTPTYRWQRMAAGGAVWTDLTADATYKGVATPTLTVGGVTLAVDGEAYRCIVTNPAGTATSSAAALRVVVSAPTFDGQPYGVSGYAGDVLQFNAYASGRPAPELRWQRMAAGGTWIDLADGAGYSGTATRFLQVTTTLAMNGDQFRCVATNLVGSAASTPATLTVRAYPVPVITRQPASATLNSGIPATLSVQASDATSYQWYKNGTLLPGQTASTLVFLDPKPSDAGNYTVTVSNRGGPVYSAGATIHVVIVPMVTITTNPRQVVSRGQSPQMSVMATGSGNLSYQWFHDGQPIPGATASIYAPTVADDRDAGAYWAGVTDANGTGYSAPYFVIVSHPTTNVVAWGMPIFGQTTVPSTLTNAVGATLGWDSAIAVTADGNNVGWGYEGFNERLPANLTNVVSVSAGRFAALALLADGTLSGTGVFGNIPAGLKNVVAISCGAEFALALRSDRTVVGWPNQDIPSDLRDVVGISAGGYHWLAVKADGTVVAGGGYGSGGSPTPPAGLTDVVAVAAGMSHSVALKADGTVVAWGNNQSSQIDVPPGLRNVVAISAASYHTLALTADGNVVGWGENGYGNSITPAGLGHAFAIAAGGHSSIALRDTLPNPPPLMISPNSAAVYQRGTATLTASTLGDPSATWQWQRNGITLNGETSATVKLTNLEPSDVGIVTVSATSATGTTFGAPAIVGIFSAGSKILGSATQVGADIVHQNGNIYDQVLLQGGAASVMADSRQVVRTSFVDLSDDIVQVEFSGSGVLSIVMDGASGPSLATKYNQPDIAYMKGHAGIVITGADESTNVSVFTVGRKTAVNQALFRDDVHYDGVADLAFIAILSSNGKFGGLRAANASFFATRGVTGIYAPQVKFTGPVYVGDIQASDSAQPFLAIGSSPDVRVTGGDLAQPNNRMVQVSGIETVRFVDGTTSNGDVLPARTNQGHLEQNGSDATAQIAVNPTQ